MISPDNILYNRLINQIHLVTQQGRLSRLAKDPFKPVLRRIAETYARIFHKFIKLRTKTFWGGKMQIIIPERSSSYMLKFGFWEEDVTVMLIDRLKPGDTFIDIGAHLGYFSLLASSIVSPDGQVHCFEPAPWALECLTENLKKSHGITINPVAVYDKPAVLPFHDYGPADSLYNSLFSVSDDEPVSTQLNKKTYTVDTVTLDQYTEEKSIVPDLIKIDAETAEYKILQGAQRIIENRKTAFILEIGGFRRDDTVKEDPAEFLISSGYSAFEYVTGSLIPFKGGQADTYKNILFTPKPL